ncbi:MAG: hypothetical protein VX945_03935 [Verrucomicrobiota bacterium]|nr:hypothetical protein [Verrucomicrobiota bacterium]
MKKIWLLSLALPFLLFPACSSEPGEGEAAPVEEPSGGMPPEGEEGAAPSNTE